MKNNRLMYVAMIFAVAFIISCKQDKREKPTPETETMVEEVSVEGKELVYETDSTSMKGYVAYNSNLKEKRPGVLVVHEWWGHNEYSRERADMLAELGYVALAVDMYGDGKMAQHPDDAGKFSGMVMKNIDVAKARFDAALEALKNNPHVDPDKIAAIGYCFGGSVVLTMADMGVDLDAVAAFHSGVQLPVMPTKDIKAKILVCNGAADPFVSEESIINYTKAMDSVGADYEYIAYEDAVHAFTSKAADSLGKKFDLPLAYNQDADEKSWAELQKLLNEVF
ncbi:dienelactone hydrolase family protein [Galbibacter sp. EGI 63066]|uniref:dienelactone hydrolase family protein n=1 Tax=Galbibacter sp. EGI 63066 TaxID=2993559 RepID=UPI002248D749|nr:dienelactone hydrolase family protein [Galbibacter sp. EGI 63066]MCX2681372.1 dienelactone hydrolase family protein [Galbibacter sp. EGI 63066]